MKIDISQIPALLDKKELKKFGDFIRSPYFNTEPRFVKVYEIIATERHNLSRELIARKIFGSDSSAGDVRFRKLVSEFMKLFERFLAEMEFSIDTLNQKFMVLEKLKKMNLRKEFLKQADDIIDYIENETVKDELYYKNMTDVYAKKYSVEEVNFKDYKKNYCFAINTYIDQYFISMKLFLFQRMYSLEYSTRLKTVNAETFNKSVYDYIDQHKEELKNYHPEIYLRYIALLLDRNGFDNKLYSEYLSVLYVTGNKFNLNQNGLLLTLLNMISKFINSGRNDLSPKVLEIAELMFNENIIIKHGISYIDLKIIIEAAISLKMFDWAVLFMKKVNSYIMHDNPANVYNFLTSKILFFKGNYSNARNLLSEISIEDYIFYCEAKLIESRIAYLEDDLESVLQITETVKKYLKVHKEIGYHYINAYKIFAEVLKKLTDVRLKYSDKNEISFIVMSLIKVLESLESPCYANDWLIEQLNVFKGIK